MIYLITGLPGASKTLNTIKFISEDDRFCEYETDSNGESTNKIKLDSEGNKVRRPVYYHNIKGLTLPWKSLTDEQAKNPQDIEAGAIIVYDECQDLFPVLPAKSAGNVPPHYAYMNKHRHNGHDVFFITQHPKNLNTQLRRLVNLHLHYKRRFGSNTSTVFEYQKCMDEPEDHFAKKEANIKSADIDSKYFGTYKSAEVHTVKKNLPVKKLVMFGGLAALTLLVLVALVVVLIKLAQNRLDGQDVEEIPEEKTSYVPVDKPSSGRTRDKVMTTSEYIEFYTPRIPDLPHSAPAYDELMQPVSAPKIAGCVYLSKRNQCRCYSQQGTRLTVSFSMCMNVIDRGYFDPTRPDDEPQRDVQRQVAYSDPEPVRPRSILIEHTPRERMTPRPSSISR